MGALHIDENRIGRQPAVTNYYCQEESVVAVVDSLCNILLLVLFSEYISETEKHYLRHILKTYFDLNKLETI